MNTLNASAPTWNGTLRALEQALADADVRTAVAACALLDRLAWACSDESLQPVVWDAANRVQRLICLAHLGSGGDGGGGGGHRAPLAKAA